MNKFVKNLLDSIDLNLTKETVPYLKNGFKDTITLKGCIKQELRDSATKIIEKELGITKDMAFCLVNNFTCYWYDRIKNKNQKCTCDICGEVVHKTDAVEIMYTTTKDACALMCKPCANIN
jgi:hypothetical protein